MSPWCFAGVSTVSRWCPWLRLGGSGLLVLVVPLWCLNGVDGPYIGVFSRERLGVNLLAHADLNTSHLMSSDLMSADLISSDLLSLSLLSLSLSLFSSNFLFSLKAGVGHERSRKCESKQEGRGKEGRTAGRKEERDKGKGLAPECCVHLPICTYYFQTAASPVQFTSVGFKMW